MKFIKKILISVVVLIFVYVIWRLLKNRVEIKNKENLSENFSIFSSSSSNEIDNLKGSEIIKIESCKENFSDLPLREYCIKASYNSALSGNYVNLDMITYVLKRGCRFLDFEIFYIGETKTDNTMRYTPRVAYSTDNTYTTINSENSILLDNVLTTVINSAFSSPTPNIKDPLFINLRVKSNNKDIYKAVAASIDNTIRQKLYVDTSSSQTPYPAIPITRDTLLSDIMGKIIICFDKTIDRNYKDSINCNPSDSTCYDLTDYINIETGSEDLNLLRYSEVMDQCSIPIDIKNNDLNTNVKTMKFVIPNIKNDNSKNPSISDFVLKHSVQIPAYRFYKKDNGLQEYEEFFNDNHTAFVPLAIAIPYLKKNTQ
jgi:hypothetical protein